RPAGGDGFVEGQPQVGVEAVLTQLEVGSDLAAATLRQPGRRRDLGLERQEMAQFADALTAYFETEVSTPLCEVVPSVPAQALDVRIQEQLTDLDDAVPNRHRYGSGKRHPGALPRHRPHLEAGT